MKSLVELNELKDEENTISLAKINWWLLKNQNTYKLTIDYKNEIKKNIIPPYSLKKDRLDLFLSVFEELEILTEYYKDEPYYQNQMEVLEKIKHDGILKEKWKIRNEKVYNEKLIYFIIEYLDHEENPRNLLLSFPGVFSFNIQIPINEFQYTIRFILEFN